MFDVSKQHGPEHFVSAIAIGAEAVGTYKPFINSLGLTSTLSFPTWCVEYSIVTEQCLTSLGFIIRPLGLMTKDVSEVKSGAGHAVNEIYLKDLKKWILIDPQYDVITMKDNVPLNAVELQSCIANNLNFGIIYPNRTTTKEEYRKWIGPYLYYLYVTINGQSVGVWDRIVGNKKQLTLLPIGAEKPTYFQKIFRINTRLDVRHSTINHYFAYAVN